VQGNTVGRNVVSEQAFIRTIVANPDDDTARLVFADWLDERDDARPVHSRSM
jgi:uncharacterized protein (TIGR02996 family)